MSRFELEQQILDCWRVTDDIKLMEEKFGDLSYADAKSFLNGMHTIYSIKFNELFNTFEKMINEKSIL